MGETAKLQAIAYDRPVRPCVDGATLEVEGPSAVANGQQKASMILGTVEYPAGARQGVHGDWYRAQLRIGVTFENNPNGNAGSYVRLFVGSGAAIMFRLTVAGHQVHWKSSTVWGTERGTLSSDHGAVLDASNYLSNFSVTAGAQDVRLELENVNGSLIRSIAVHRDGTGIDATRESPYPLRVDSAELLKVDGRVDAVEVNLSNQSRNYSVSGIELRVETSAEVLARETTRAMLPGERRMISLELPSSEQSNESLLEARVLVDSDRNRPWRPIGIPTSRSAIPSLVGSLWIATLALISLGTYPAYAGALVARGTWNLVIVACALTAAAILLGAAAGLDLSPAAGPVVLVMLVLFQLGSIVAVWLALGECSRWGAIGLAVALGTVAIPLVTPLALVLRIVVLAAATIAIVRGRLVLRRAACV